MNAARETRCHLSDGILSIDADKVGKRGEECGIGKRPRLDAVMQRLFPRVEDVTERSLPVRIASR
jgi:hypothetical protein